MQAAGILSRRHPDHILSRRTPSADISTSKHTAGELKKPSAIIGAEEEEIIHVRSVYIYELELKLRLIRQEAMPTKKEGVK